MKNIITSIFVFLSLNLSAQNLDYKDINFNMLDSLVLEEVNQRRKDLGVSIIHYSKVIHEMVSKEQTRILLTEERVYHPNKKSLYDKILLDLKKNVMIIIILL
jgi:hypothetical protein